MIVKIPYTDGEHVGCAKAPDVIVEKLREIWSNTDFSEVKMPGVVEGSIDNIPEGKIYLGGDHTITYHIVKEFVKKNPNTGFIVFDAHPDVYQAFDKPSHQDYLKFLIEEGVLSPSNIIVIGIRAAHPSEMEYYMVKGIRYYSSEVRDMENLGDIMTEFLQDFNSVYVSIDIDAVDPAFAPGVSYTEPAGLSSRDMLYFAKRLKSLRNIKAIDLVEVNPDNDLNGMTSKLAAKIVAEFL